LNSFDHSNAATFFLKNKHSPKSGLIDQSRFILFLQAVLKRLAFLLGTIIFTARKGKAAHLPRLDRKTAFV